MSIVVLLNSLRRLSLLEKSGKSVSLVRSVFTDSPLGFQVSPYLCAEPLKRKKRLDPAIIRAREEKRKRRLEKQIRKLEKGSRQLKPIDECEIPSALLEVDDIKLRERKLPTLSEAEVDRRVTIMKEWTRYRHQQALSDLKTIDRLALAQTRALEELRLESEELYQEAIQIDPGLLPFKIKGPVMTPPIKDYDSPDGDYIDISKKWN